MLEVALRQYLAGEGRAAAERLVASLGQEMLPAMAERLARQHLEQLPGSLAARVEALVPQLREQMLETARRAATAASRQQIEVEGRGALEAAIRQYLASEGGGLAERLVATLAGEAVPAIAERLVQRELDRLPNPAVKLEELLAHLREQLREDARRGVEAIARRYVESSGRTVVEEVIRQYAGSQGVEVAEELIRASTREIVPTIAERLVQRELERLPGPAAKVEEVLAQLREQLREDARRAIETIARRYAETDGRATVESVIRQYVATQGVGLADDFVRGSRTCRRPRRGSRRCWRSSASSCGRTDGARSRPSPAGTRRPRAGVPSRPSSGTSWARRAEPWRMTSCGRSRGKWCRRSPSG